MAANSEYQAKLLKELGLQTTCSMYISWEMTPTSIGGEKQAGISGGSQFPS